MTLRARLAQLIEELSGGNNFNRNVLILLKGSALGQIITLVASPILTRIYDVDEFAIFSVYLSAISIGSLIIALRYEMAIMLPKSERIAYRVASLSWMIAVVVACSLFFVLPFIQGYFISLSKLSLWIYLIPAHALLMISLRILIALRTKQKEFEAVSRNKVIQPGSTVSFQLGLGGMGVGAFGLIAGNRYWASDRDPDPFASEGQ